MREGECGVVDVDGRTKTRLTAPNGRALDPPTRLPHEETVDREAVAVGPQPQAGKVDVDTGCPISTRAQPVRPRREQWEAERRPGTQRREPARERQMVPSTVAKRDSGQPQVRKEGGAQLSSRDDHGRLAAEPALLHAGGAAHTTPTRRTGALAALRSRSCSAHACWISSIDVLGGHATALISSLLPGSDR